MRFKLCSRKPSLLIRWPWIIHYMSTKHGHKRWRSHYCMILVGFTCNYPPLSLNVYLIALNFLRVMWMLFNKIPGRGSMIIQSSFILSGILKAASLLYLWIYININCALRPKQRNIYIWVSVCVSVKSRPMLHSAMRAKQLQSLYIQYTTCIT